MRKQSSDLLIVAGLAIGGMAAPLSAADNLAIGLLFGLPLALVLPGYALVAAGAPSGALWPALLGEQPARYRHMCAGRPVAERDAVKPAAGWLGHPAGGITLAQRHRPPAAAGCRRHLSRRCARARPRLRDLAPFGWRAGCGWRVRGGDGGAARPPADGFTAVSDAAGRSASAHRRAKWRGAGSALFSCAGGRWAAYLSLGAARSYKLGARW
ncbi:MAG: hypothetical protein U0Z44_15495 [Kouleothrix sp.]